MLLRVTLVRELNLLPFLYGNEFTQQWIKSFVEAGRLRHQNADVRF